MCVSDMDTCCTCLRHATSNRHNDSSCHDLHTRQGHTCMPREELRLLTGTRTLQSHTSRLFMCSTARSNVCVGQQCLGSFEEKHYMRMLNLHTQKVKTGSHIVDPHLPSSSASLIELYLSLKELGNDVRPCCGQPLCVDQWASTNSTSIAPGRHP